MKKRIVSAVGEREMKRCRKVRYKKQMHKDLCCLYRHRIALTIAA